MNISAINPHIRYAGIQHVTLRKPHYSVCYDCRLFHLKNIKGTLFVGETGYEIGQEATIFFPPGTKYRFAVNKTENSRILVLDFDLTREYENITESLGTSKVSDFDPEKILRYDLPSEFSKPIILSEAVSGEKIEGCINDFLKKAMFYRETSSSMLRLCLINLLCGDLLINPDVPVVRAVKNYIRENYSNNELTNESIAKAIGYHPYYLSQLIKKSTGVTLRQFLLDYRFEVAKNYLSATDFDISLIAWKCGFTTASHFIKIFREKNGITPKKYRENSASFNI